jgi:heme-degrading monooxygenase HmoA
MVEPATIDRQMEGARAALEARAARSSALEAFALHCAHDGTRIVTIEAWRDAAAFHRDHDAADPTAALYAWAATGGRNPTPVDDPGAGVIVIDTFAVWRPLLGPVSSFNIRNGEAFNRSPGCISTTVLRGVGVGSIATYARWRSVADFAAAFSTATGKPAQSADDVNRAAARMTFGFIRPDYHSYELVIAKDRKP